MGPQGGPGLASASSTVTTEWGLAALCKVTPVLPLKFIKLWNQSQHRETINTSGDAAIDKIPPPSGCTGSSPKASGSRVGSPSCQTPCHAALRPTLKGCLSADGVGSRAGLQYSLLLHSGPALTWTLDRPHSPAPLPLPL